MKKTVINHLLGDTIIFLFAITTSFFITTLLKINAQKQYIIVFLLVIVFVYLGEKLVKRYLPHLLRDSKETTFELILLIVVLFFLGEFISDKMNVWLVITLYYVVYVIFTALFERIALGKQ